MVQRCSVPLCDTKVGEVDVKGAKVRFHRIPLTPEKFIKWRNQITHFGLYKPEPELTVNSRICSKHFLREDYITDEEQKPGTAGNHVLAKDAAPTIFKWNDETSATLSRAVPYVKKADLQNTLNGLSVPSKSQEVQCSIEEDRLKIELQRKNNVIRQLLHRLGELEEEKISIINNSNNNKQQQDSISSMIQTTTNSCTTTSQQTLVTWTCFADDGKEKAIVESASESTPSLLLNRTTHSPEMPTLKPSVPLPLPSNLHALQEKLEKPCCSTTTTTTSTAIDDFKNKVHATISPQRSQNTFVLTNQTGSDNKNYDDEVDASPNKIVPNISNNTQRVSVIKRAGGGISCCNKSADFSKPPKKRQLSYFYGD